MGLTTQSVRHAVLPTFILGCMVGCLQLADLSLACGIFHMCSSQAHMCGSGIIFCLKMYALPISNTILGLYAASSGLASHMSQTNTALATSTIVTCHNTTAPPFNAVMMGCVHQCTMCVRSRGATIPACLIVLAILLGYCSYTLATCLSPSYTTITAAGASLVVNHGIIYSVVSCGSSYNLLSPAAACTAGILILALALIVLLGVAIFWYGVLKAVQCIAVLQLPSDSILLYFNIMSWSWLFAAGCTIGVSSQSKTEALVAGGLLTYVWAALIVLMY
jgi:hypothetical protein